MAKVVYCDCGFVGRGADDEELVTAVIEHAREAHATEMTREQVLALAVSE